MSQLRIAAMALLVVVVAPLVLGWVWPSGTETVDTWTADKGIDITPSIANSEIPITDSYSGPMNHYWLYGGDGYSAYSPVAYGSAVSPIPGLSYTTASESVTTSGQTINFRAFEGYRIDYSTVVPNIDVEMTDGESYSCITAAYMPDSNTVYIMGGGHYGEAVKADEIRRISVQGASSANPVLLKTKTYTQTGEYVDMSKGFVLDNDLDPDGLEWFNGMRNHVIEIWVKSESIAAASTIQGGGASVALQLSGGRIMADGRMLGSASAYPFISIVLDSDAGSAEVRGLIGAESFTDPSWSVGNVIATSGPTSPITSLSLAGEFEYEIKRTYSEIGTGRGIVDASIVPYSYYPKNAWQVSFGSLARFGESITVGSITYPVTAGQISFTDLSGEDRTVSIRGMAILSLVFGDGPHDEEYQHIYINGFEVWSGAQNSNYAVTLNGDWYVPITVSDVTQGEQTSYVWKLGSFSLDKTGYCMAGIMSCVLVMIGAGLWGRASGTKMLLVMTTMIICAAAYYCLI